MLTGMLNDPIRAVRMEAASALAGAQPEMIETAQQVVYRRVLDEYVAAQTFNADRPEPHLNLARLRADQVDAASAEASLRKALDIAPDFAAAVVNLADLYSATLRKAWRSKRYGISLRATPTKVWRIMHWACR